MIFVSPFFAIFDFPDRLLVKVKLNRDGGLPILSSLPSSLLVKARSSHAERAMSLDL